MWYEKAKNMQLPRFELSPHWGKRNERFSSLQEVPLPPEKYEEALGGVSTGFGEASQMYTSHNLGKNIKGFSSVFVGPSGQVFVIPSHQHLDVAGRVLSTLHPSGPKGGINMKQKGKGWDHSDLSSASGIMRAQVWRDGVGVSINMENPPNQKQLDAIRDLFSKTSQDRFVAEVTDREGNLVIDSYAGLVAYVKNYGKEFKEVSPLWDRFITEG